MAKAEVESGKPLLDFVGKLGDRSTSDVIVRLRTGDGRDDWFYSHSVVLCKQSEYFAARLSDDWPTYHLLDSRNCVELLCFESDIDYHVTLLRLLYARDDMLVGMWHNVKNALGVLKVATKLGCEKIVAKCVEYLEAVPWEEKEEEEILRTLPGLGASVFPVLARIQPVDPEAVRNVFLSAIRMATLPERKAFVLGNLPSELKVAAQEQVEYMLVEDDDAPLLVADDRVKSALKSSFMSLFQSFKQELGAIFSNNDPEVELSDEFLLEKVSDLAWASRILPRMGLFHEMVVCWVDLSDDVLKVLHNEKLKDIFWNTKLKVVELTAKVLEAVGYGTVILPVEQRTCLVRLWLPYVREIKPLFDSHFHSGIMLQQMDGELSQTIESAFVSLVLSLPSADQAHILADWLQTDQARYPDLTEAFEIWCFRSKSAKRRFNTEVSDAETAPISSGSCGA